MSRINQIEEKLRQIEGGCFQTLASQYLFRRYSLDNCVNYGSNFGTDKTTTGVPDMYSTKDGKFFFAAFTTSTSNIKNKLLSDARDCFNVSKTHVNLSNIERVVLCHTTPRLDPSIIVEVQNIDPRIEIIGPETIAEDLDKKYPSLAFLTLGVPLGKGSFISPEVFINRCSHGRFTTNQSNPLLYRDNDMSDIINLINRNKAVLIYGQSGCGKTRIALEACRKYSIEKCWDFLILDSKYSENIDEDIELILTESKNLIILVDDANNQVSMRHLLSVCAGNENLKIVFTCRRMYRNELVTTIETCLDYVETELKPLSIDEINTILEEEYGITNSSFRERVTGIANGNLRLAIMAALSVTEGNCEAVREPYDLLKFYMNSALDNYTYKERSLIEMIAIYDGLDIVEGDSCYKKLLDTGYNKSEIQATVSKLEKQEIVTTLLSPDGELGVRMEEQNLQDFLVCHHFAKANNGSYADFIVSTSQMSRPLYLKAARSMAEVCGSDEVNDYIRKECEKAWNILEKGDRKVVDQFLTALNQFIPLKALSYVTKYIEESTEVDISKELLDKCMTSDGSVVLSILVSLMDVKEYTDAALSLFVRCIEKGIEHPSQFKWACVNNAFSYTVENTKFKLENKKLDVLVDKFQETGSYNVAACLILLVEAYLTSRIDQVRFDGISYKIRSFKYNLTSELIDLHVRCFEALFNLIGTELEERVKSIFRHRFYFNEEKLTVEHAKSMKEILLRIENLLPNYINKDSIVDLSCALRVNQIYEACGQSSFFDLKQFSQATLDALDCENAVSSTERDYETLTKSFSIDRLKGILPKLAEDRLLSEKMWVADRAIENVLFEVSKRETNSAVKIITDFMVQWKDAHVVPTSALNYLVSQIGAKQLRKELSNKLDISVYPALFDKLDLLVIDEGFDDQVLNDILIRLEDGKFHLDLMTLEKIELKAPGYALKYTIKFSECAKDLCNIWRFFGNMDDMFTSALINRFSSNLSPIISLYFCAIEGYLNFDYNFKISRSIISINPSVANQFIEYSSRHTFDARHKFMKRMSIFWTDLEEIVWQFLKLYIENTLNKPSKYLYIPSLIPIYDTEALSSSIFWDRFELLIVENLSSRENLYAISCAISDFNDEARIRALSYILSIDKEGLTIGCLNLRRMSMHGSFEAGFVSERKREIDVLKAVIQRLPSESLYLKHKEWLDENIKNIETEIDREKWELFHGRH